MKTLRFIGMAIIAVIMSVNFVACSSDDNDEKPPDFGQGKTKFPEELHHVFNEVAHSCPASCCIWKLGSYVIGSIDSLASTE